MGLLNLAPFSFPGVNAWATENHLNWGTTIRMFMQSAALGHGRINVIAILLVAGFFCLRSPVYSNSVIELPLPTGSFPVGTMILYWTDSSRVEKMSGKEGSHRELIAQLWYPARPTSNAVYAPYIPNIDTILAHRRQLEAQNFNRVYLDLAKALRTHAILNAEISDAKQKYPVVIFSHGNGAIRSVYTNFMEELASHGYVVVSLDHPYGAAVVAFSDGRVIIQPNDWNTLQPFADRVSTWAADQRFALDQIEKLAAPGSVFTGHLDLDHIGVMGHSLGGISAAKTCSMDQRFKACVNLDGGTGEMSDALESELRQPFMLLTKPGASVVQATDKQLAAWGLSRKQYEELMQKSTSQREAIQQKIKSTAYQIIIRGAEHNSFSDTRLLEGDNRGIDARRALRIINDYVLAFLDKNLTGDKGQLLDNSSPSYPEVTIKIFKPELH